MSETDSKPYEILIIENNAFKERIKALESKLANVQHAARAESQTRLFQLVKEKDKALEDYMARMDNKIKSLEAEVGRLNAEKNNMQAAFTVLSIYQLVFENASESIICVDPHGLIIQFNPAAIDLFGMELHHLRSNHISKLRLDGVNINFEDIVKQSIKPDGHVHMEFEYSSIRYVLNTYRLSDIDGIRGIAVCIHTKSG